MLENAMDLRNKFSLLTYNPKFEEIKNESIKNLEPFFKLLSDFLGEKSYFAAEYLTFPDFFMYEMLFSHQKLAPELINKFQNLVEYIKRFENLPKIANFLKSDRCPKPMNNKMAKFGNA